MELLQHTSPDQGRPGVIPQEVTPAEDRAARRALRGQIARLERELSAAFLTAYEMRTTLPVVTSAAAPRLLDLEDLERVRDELVARLSAVRHRIAAVADEQAAKRLLLEEMLLEPGRYRFVRITRQELGEPDCGAWEVRPRLGLVGMLMGWWQVKLSSGCPLAGGRGTCRGPLEPLCLNPPSTGYPRSMRKYVRTGAAGVVVLLIMFIGSLILWIGTPVLWLWVGSQIQGATDSVGTALGAAFVGVVITIAVLAVLLARLSNIYRANAVARGRGDPGHFVLEGVLVISAAITLVGFTVWFFLLSGAEPIPLGLPKG